MPILSFMPVSSMRRKEQRLDHHRHHPGGLERRADVDVIELAQLDAVDRDPTICLV
jgi:hypothetical protein